MSQYGRTDASEIARRNKKVDPQKLREYEKVIENLRAHGVQPKKYELTPPFQRKLRVRRSRR